MADSPEVDGLMKEVSRGNRDAFPRLFELLWPSVLRLCVSVMGSADDGADVAQTAMLCILERANEYDWHRPGLPWALGVATWTCRTHRKQQARRRESPESDIERDDGGDEMQAHEQRQLLEAAFKAMGTLSVADQETLISTYWETASPVSGATFRQRRARALNRLRHAFRRLYGLD